MPKTPSSYTILTATKEKLDLRMDRFGLKNSYPQTDPAELAKIHETSNKNNPKVNLTGILVFGEDQFLQCIEGGRSEINALYAKICRDPRHESPVLISYMDIAKREFEKWDMKLVLMTEKNQNLLLTYSSSKKFDPMNMGADSVYSFLLSLRSQ